MVWEEFGIMESDLNGLSQRSAVYRKIEQILQKMQNSENGISVKTTKNFSSSNADSFSGSDFVSWLAENLPTEDRLEAIHLAALFWQLGYIYHASSDGSSSSNSSSNSSSSRAATIKDDSTLYRFQTPYFWPSLNSHPDYTEYAIYLTKRSLRNKQKHGLDENEQMALSKLRKMLCDKWDFIYMQAQEQVRLLKERKKIEKQILTSQERTFWKIQSTLPSQINCLEMEKNSFCRRSTNPHMHRLSSIDSARKQVQLLESSLKLSRLKTSKVADSLMHRCELYREYDPFLVDPIPSNPWITDDPSIWSLDSVLSTDAPIERRVRRWSFGLNELLRDSSGYKEFLFFLEKEFSAENIRFWSAVEQMKQLSQSQIKTAADEIFREYLTPGAPNEINIDSRTMSETISRLEHPTRLMYDLAQDHIFLLMKKDSYPRFLRSDQYHGLLRLTQTTTTRRKIFSFGSKKQNKSQSPRMKRRGSTSRVASHAPSGEELLGTTTLSQHSYSTGNLIDMDSYRSGKSTPYGSSGSVGDEPSQGVKRFSPINLRRKLEDFFLSPSSSSPHRTKLEVPRQHVVSQVPPTINRECSELTVNFTVPSPGVENVIAPWEQILNNAECVVNVVQAVAE